MLGLSINPFAVIVGALAAFLLGALWYSPLVPGRQWVAAHGYLAANLFSEKPIAAYLIDAGYQLVYLVVMGAIIGACQ